MENKFDKLARLREFASSLSQIASAAQALYDDVDWDELDGLESQSLDVIGDYHGSMCEQIGNATKGLQDALFDIRELGIALEDASDNVLRMEEEIDLYVEDDSEDDLEDEAA